MRPVAPAIRGVMYLGLSVRDVRRSADWYRALLDLQVERESLVGPESAAPWDEVLLRDKRSGLLLGLLKHRQNSGEPFSEFRTGLDHVEFEVETMEQLNEWRKRLDQLGIHWTRNHSHLLTFRDPDTIQLEFFCPAHED